MAHAHTLAEDLADGCIRIAKRGATGIFNLSGPDGMNILELVQRVGKTSCTSVRSVC